MLLEEDPPSPAVDDDDRDPPDPPAVRRACWAEVLACSLSYCSSRRRYDLAERKVCGGWRDVMAGMAWRYLELSPRSMVRT